MIVEIKLIQYKTGKIYGVYRKLWWKISICFIPWFLCMRKPKLFCILAVVSNYYHKPLPSLQRTQIYIFASKSIQTYVLKLFMIVLQLFLFDCLFVCLGSIVPVENFSLIWRSHHYRWRAANFDLCSALMAIEQWEFFSVSHLLWHGHPFIIIISEDPWHSHLLSSV